MTADKTLPIRFTDQEQILREAGVSPTVARAGDIAARIANDPQVQSIASRLAAESFITAAIGELTPEQKERLVNRAARDTHSPVPPKAVVEKRAVWTIGYTENSNQLFIGASYDRGHGLVDTAHFIGHPEKITKFRRAADGTWTPYMFRHEAVPPEIAAEYARLYPTSVNNTDLGAQMGAYYGNLHQPKQDFSLCPGPDYADNKAANSTKPVRK